MAAAKLVLGSSKRRNDDSSRKRRTVCGTEIGQNSPVRAIWGRLTETCDNPARLPSVPDLKWEDVGAQLEHLAIHTHTYIHTYNIYVCVKSLRV